MSEHVLSSRALRCAVVTSALLAAACEVPTASESPAPEARVTATSRAAANLADGTVCTGSGAHDKHDFPSGCTLCHACGGVLGFSLVTLPGGTSTEDGVITRGATDTSCTVQCHGTQPVSWSAVGPLACSSCHDDVVAPGVVYESMHAQTHADPATERSGCQGCHDMSGHTGGTIRIALGDGTYVEAGNGDAEGLASACLACHDGAGNPISGQTPPTVIAGWTSPAGDFHGVRKGTGYGGTLRPPFVRGQDPVGCTSCHAAHASQNPYLLAGEVNGLPLPPELVNSAGQGAEHLCASCHEGERHQGCVDCHGVDPVPGGGTACFTCHGHEGIVVWPAPVQGRPRHYDGPQQNCVHCHTPGWMPVVEFIPPVVSNVAIASGAVDVATVSWRTDEVAAASVEYGPDGVLNRVASVPGYNVNHAVTLTGLESATTYSFRIRAKDRLRNVRYSAVQTFRTFNPSSPPAPTLQPAPDIVLCDDFITSTPQTFRWNAVSSPVGNPVQYRVVADNSPAFDSLAVDSGWISSTSYTATLPLSWDPDVSYYRWRVKARDAVTLAEGQYSAVGAFWAALACY